MAKPDYDTTIARIAGNIAGIVLAQTHSGHTALGDDALTIIAATSVQIARAIVAEVKRTTPETSQWNS